MEFSFENHGTNTYLVYSVKPEDVIDTLSLGMLTNNKILGLAPTQFYQMDMSKYIKYNISSHISVKQFFEGAVNRKRLLGVFRGIVDALLSAEDYMIDPNSIVIDLNYMFADVSTCETELICLPIVDAVKEQQDLGSFFKNIMFSTQFDQTDNCDYVAKIINYLNSATNFSLTEFKDVLESIDDVTLKPKIEKKPQSVVSNHVATDTSTSQSPIQQTVLPQAISNPEIMKQTLPVQQPKDIGMKLNTAKQPKGSVASNPSGMAIPGQNNSATAASAEVPTVQTKSQEISWLYLMQHYNKENAAIYKAQQDAKKAAKTTATPDKKEKKGKAPTPAVPNTTFAIPGQQAEAPKPMTSTPVAPAPATKPTHIPAQSAPQVPPTPQPASQPVTYTPPTPQPMPQTTGMPANFGETTVLSVAGCGETTVLGVAPTRQEIIPYLIRRKNNEKIILNKPVFRVGKERSYVDYFIGDNTAISRSHANIITREGSYFVVDTNSTNHTFVNGNMLNSNEEVQINHGDSIRFANEDFEFKCY